MMTTADVFMADILDRPDDDAPRLIFADWLEDNGQADRAEFIRLQCAIQTGALHDRAVQLLRAHWEEWAGPLRELVGSNASRMNQGWLLGGMHREDVRRFRRGFVESLTLDTTTFLQRAEELYRLAPIRHLSLWGGEGRIQELANCPHLAPLETLAFVDRYSAPLGPPDARALASSPHLKRLTYLYLYGNNVGDEGVLALLSAPWLNQLLILELDDCGLGDRSAFALAECPALRNLETLSISRNAITPAGERALRNSPHLTRVRSLRFGS
jgi:uncharacterized protein (TIGR02996 family)